MLTRSITRLSVAAAAIAFMVLLVALFSQFAAREVFGHGLIGADELARISFVWCSLFAASAAWSKNELHRIDLLTRHLRGYTAIAVARATYLLVAIALVYLIYYGFMMMVRALGQTTSTLEVSGAWLYAPVPLAASLMLIVSLQRLTGPMAQDQSAGRDFDSPGT